MTLKIETKHIFWLLILAFVWGANYLFIKIAITGLPPLLAIAIRAISATLFLMIALPLMKIRFWSYLTHRRLQLTSAITGVLIAYMWFTMAHAETILTASMTSLIIAVLPIFAWLIATFIYREKPFYWLNLCGLALAFIGLFVMIGIHELVTQGTQIYYALFYMSGLLAFAISAALTSHNCRQLNPALSVAYTTFYTMVYLCLLSIFNYPVLHIHYPLAAVLGACGTGVISTGFGYLIYFWLLTHAGQIFAASNAYLVPIAGFILGVLILKEPAFLHQIIGLCIVFLGTYFTNKHP